MHRPFLAAGFALGMLGVAAGAFGAHGLRGMLEPTSLATFETAVRYQLVHALALIGLALAASRWPAKGWSLPGLLFVIGTLIFSGSLYALAMSGAGLFGALAPIGGVALILGWGAALLVALRQT